MYWLTAAWVMPNLLATSTCEKPYFSTSSLASKDLKAGKNVRPTTSQGNSTAPRLVGEFNNVMGINVSEELQSFNYRTFDA